jgi:hypothetical protein
MSEIGEKKKKPKQKRNSHANADANELREMMGLVMRQHGVPYMIRTLPVGDFMVRIPKKKRKNFLQFLILSFTFSVDQKRDCQWTRS